MLDINKQAMKYSLQGQTVTIYERDGEGNILYYTDNDGEPYLDSEGNKIPKILEEKQVFQNRLILKLTYHLAVEKRRVKNTALIPLILTLFY